MANTCKSCSAPVEWVKSARSGKVMPLDLEPVADGNLIVNNGFAHAVLPADSTEHPRRKSHFATCPQADSWRRR